MTTLDRTVDEAIAFGRQQMAHPTQSWAGLCQSFVRHSYDVPAWALSASRAWDAIPALEKTAGTDPREAPRGAALYYKGGRFGHVALAIGKRTDDKCLSNDYTERGRIGVAPRTFDRWGITYVGWSFWTPFGELMPGRAELWDGRVPPLSAVVEAEEKRVANKAAWRLTCRLADLGYYRGEVRPEGEQRYPEKAVRRFRLERGWGDSTGYGPRIHAAVFP